MKNNFVFKFVIQLVYLVEKGANNCFLVFRPAVWLEWQKKKLETETNESIANCKVLRHSEALPGELRGRHFPLCFRSSAPSCPSISRSLESSHHHHSHSNLFSGNGDGQRPAEIS
jgi:hypothetical protein